MDHNREYLNPQNKNEQHSKIDLTSLFRDALRQWWVILIFALSDRGVISGLLSKDKMLKMGTISMEFYLIHYLVINYGMIAAKHFGFDKGIAVLPLTILFFAISFYGACMIKYLSKIRLLLKD